jgi:hypothetical protein
MKLYEHPRYPRAGTNLGLSISNKIFLKSTLKPLHDWPVAGIDAPALILAILPGVPYCASSDHALKLDTADRPISGVSR